MVQLLDHRVERAVDVIGRALVAERDVRLPAESLAQRPDEPRLADPGLADEQDHLALAGLRLLPALEQQRQLLLAADQRQ